MAGWRETIARRLGMTITREVRGFPVEVDNSVRPDIDVDRVYANLADALDVIARYEPQRFAQLQQDIARFVVRRFPCRGAFFPSMRACLTELTFVGEGKFTPAQVAASIVHEGMHAHCHAMGTGGIGGADEERLCRQAELEFGRSLPAADAAPVIERALASLALEDQDVAPEVDWALAAERMAAVDRRATER
jgi:hypothetical protein